MAASPRSACMSRPYLKATLPSSLAARRTAPRGGLLLRASAKRIFMSCRLGFAALARQRRPHAEHGGGFRMGADLYQEPWVALEEILSARDAETLRAYLATLPPSETARVISRLHADSRSRLLTLLPADEAAAVLEQLS